MHSVKLVPSLETVYLTDVPSKCPFCHHAISPEPLVGIRIRRGGFDLLDILFSCPNRECIESFLGHYIFYSQKSYNLLKVSMGRLSVSQFSETIETVSANFISIYQEAEMAEKMGLLQICGVGYRKAIEFLIKDYAISKHPSEEELIKKNTLAKCIGDYISDPKVKPVAERAVWLGNDETHYVRKWEDKDLKDLKILIQLTLKWIEAEVLSAEFEASMPK